ncbi:tropomyosin [Dorcoceras hygrometricum]|uniref:Tropomyosin n=1 Tax=Dorcoceras hygrometricum TaxID=472368 RepID=A0A2Z7BZ13_9LAMI|nr:tropomyosin [Dorcoceras hygrometricum]
MEHKVESARAELLLGLKEREAFSYKHRYEDVVDEMADFKEWFDYLTHKCSEPKDISNDMSCKGQDQKTKALQEEFKRVKAEFEKFKSDKSCEISALLAEKNFLWNQYNNMESQMNNKFRKKCDEVDHANEMAKVMVNRADELQLSNAKLRADFSKMESELSEKNQEISRLLKEIAELKSSSRSATPVLQKCTAGSRAPHMGAKISSNNGSGITTVKQELDHTLTSEKITRAKPAAHKSTGGKAPRKQLNAKGSSSSKSNEVEIITIPDSPKLFTSSFRVPKLRSQSPRVV